MAAKEMSQDLLKDTLDLIAKHNGSITRAAAEIGISKHTLKSRCTKARRLVRSGVISAPPIPDIGLPPTGMMVNKNSAKYDADGNLINQWVGTIRDSGDEYKIPLQHIVKGESAYVDNDGRVRFKWIKTKLDTTLDLIAALERKLELYSPAPLLQFPTTSVRELLTVYPLVDLHHGLYTDEDESGDAYNLDISRSTILNGVSKLVSRSPISRQAVILNTGDLFHQNDQTNTTPQSKHPLDVAGRWHQVFDTGVQMMINLIDIAAQKHETVYVVMIPGNHDPDAAICLRTTLRFLYRNNPRIIIHDKPGLHWFYRFGNCLLGATHGHNMSPRQMALMLMNDCKNDYGETLYHSFFHGHIHHEKVVEVGSVRVESFGTPIPKDGYAMGAGYRSARTMSAITFNRDDGEITRIREPILSNLSRQKLVDCSI